MMTDMHKGGIGDPRQTHARTARSAQLFRLMVGIACLLCFSGWRWFAQTQPEAALRFEPETTRLAPGETTRVRLVVENASGLYGVEIHLRYDPDVVRILDSDSITRGVQAQPGDFLDVNRGFLVMNQADPVEGVFVYALTLLAPAEAVSGDGTIFELELAAEVAGTSPLVLEEVILASAQGESLPFSSQDGEVIVSTGSTQTATSLAPTVTPTATRTPLPQAPTATPSPTAIPVLPSETTEATLEPPDGSTGLQISSPSPTVTAALADQLPTETLSGAVGLETTPLADSYPGPAPLPTAAIPAEETGLLVWVVVIGIGVVVLVGWFAIRWIRQNQQH